MSIDRTQGTRGRIGRYCLFLFAAYSATLSAQARDSKAALRAAVDTSAAALAAARDLDGLVEIKQPGLPFGSIRGFNSLEVKATSDASRKALVDALAARELAALRAYVLEFFPTPSVRTISVSQMVQGSCSVDPCPVELAEPESVASAYSEIHEFARKVATSTAFKVSIRVSSVPPAARFSIQPIGGGVPQEVSTNSPLGEIYRGLYQYKVERSGYKTATANLNLVDNSPEVLHCLLVPSDSHLDPVPCLFGLLE